MLSLRLSLLSNKLFKHRYIRRNSAQLQNLIGFVYFHTSNASMGGGRSNAWLQARLAKLARSFLKRFGTTYVRLRLLLGFIDIPQLTIVLTTKCTLRCEGCSNLMQYFTPSDHFTTDLNSIQNDIERLLQGVSSISSIHIIGGETLLFKQLPELMHFLASKKQIKALELITNATIPFSQKLLDSLAYKKTRVIISDYSANPELTKTLRQEQILQALREHNIKHIFYHQNSLWRDMGRIYKRNRTDDENKRNFLACDIPCVTFIGADSSDKTQKGGIFVCSLASSLAKLRSQAEFAGDFVSLDSSTLSSDILRFYAQDFFKSCDYCPNKWEHSDGIPVALQTKETLTLSPPVS